MHQRKVHHPIQINTIIPNSKIHKNIKNSFNYNILKVFVVSFSLFWIFLFFRIYDFTQDLNSHANNLIHKEEGRHNSNVNILQHRSKSSTFWGTIFPPHSSKSNNNKKKRKNDDTNAKEIQVDQSLNHIPRNLILFDFPTSSSSTTTASSNNNRKNSSLNSSSSSWQKFTSWGETEPYVIYYFSSLEQVLEFQSLNGLDLLANLDSVEKLNPHSAADKYSFTATSGTTTSEDKKLTLQTLQILTQNNEAEFLDILKLLLLKELGGIFVDASVTLPIVDGYKKKTDPNDLNTIELPHVIDALPSYIDSIFKSNVSSFSLNFLTPNSVWKNNLVVGLCGDFEVLDDAFEWSQGQTLSACHHVLAATPQNPMIHQTLVLQLFHVLNQKFVDVDEVVSRTFGNQMPPPGDRLDYLTRNLRTGSGPLSYVIFNGVEPYKTIYNTEELAKISAATASIIHIPSASSSTVCILPMGSFDPSANKNKRLKRMKKATEAILLNQDDSLNSRVVHETVHHDYYLFDKKDLYFVYPRTVKFDKKHVKASSNILSQGQSYTRLEDNDLPMGDRYGHIMAPKYFLAGIVRDAGAISPTPFDYLVELNCRFRVNVQIVAAKGIREFEERYSDAIKKMEKKMSHSAMENRCAQVDLIEEPKNLIAKLDNRIDRISRLRDYQRKHLSELLDGGWMEDIIMLVDLDLHSLPPTRQLMYQALQMQSKPGGSFNIDSNNKKQQQPIPDVLCSNGIMHHPYGYYDLFATVLYPDTFLYPVKHRLEGLSWDEEDLSLVRSYDEFGEVTSWDFLDWLDAQSEKLRGQDHNFFIPQVIERNKNQSSNNSGNNNDFDLLQLAGNDKEYVPYVPVRSCFGGLALYRATKLLEAQCTYDIFSHREKQRLMKYANRDDKRPCEHVVFHDCLLNTDSNIIIGIQPNMKTMWNDTPPPTDRLVSNSDRDAIMTFFKQSDRGDRITSPNGRHSLRINEEGKLVIESCLSTLFCWKPEVKWIANPNQEVKPNWTHMFLVLEASGDLTLLKQIPKKRLNSEKCGRPNDESCQLEVWTTRVENDDDNNGNKKKKKEDGRQRFTLVLTDDGILEIQDLLLQQKVIWRNID